MACPNASAPLNIVASDKTCNSKCAYSFQYPISNMIISNKGEYLKLNTEVLTNLPPVQYRQSGYLLQEGRLYVPSIHTYGAENETAPAELIFQRLEKQAHRVRRNAEQAHAERGRQHHCPVPVPFRARSGDFGGD